MCSMSPRLLRPVASGFDPRRIANLGLWLDASNDSSLTFNATTVSEWRDLSGNARHYAQSTAGSQPGTSTLNGRRVLSSSGAEFLTGNAAATTIAQDVPGITVIAVASVVSVNNTNLVFVSHGLNVNAARVLLGRNSANSGGTFGIGGRRLDANSYAGIGYAAGTGSDVYAGVLDHANSDAFLFAGGAQQASTTSFQTDGNTSNTASLGVSLFANALGNGGSTATIGELLIYARALTASERQRVERYLGRKWGITVA